MTDIRFRSDVTVELVKHTAFDGGVTAAARVSTIADASLSDFNADPDDDSRIKGLINYLMRDRHGSPFEHNSMTFFVQAPIFVFREFMRHRVGWSYNEESGRYKELEPVFYIPDEDRNIVQTGKPGRYTFVEGTDTQHRLLVDTMSHAYWDAYDAYRLLLNDGVAREVARMVLPVGIYSSMYATCNARSLMHFLSLRTQHDLAKIRSFPQQEIAWVAARMEMEWAQLMPLTYEAFNTNGRVAP